MPQCTTVKATNQIIKVAGKVFYNDRRRRIDLKHPIRDLFPDGSVKYVMELCLSKEGIIKRVEQLVKEEIRPVLLYFDAEETDDLS